MTDQQLAEIIESCAATNSYFDDETAVLTPKWLWVSLPEMCSFIPLESHSLLPSLIENSELIVRASNYVNLNYNVYTTRKLYREHAGIIARVFSILGNRILA